MNPKNVIHSVYFLLYQILENQTAFKAFPPIVNNFVNLRCSYKYSNAND